jgi:hypothetical protein
VTPTRKTNAIRGAAEFAVWYLVYDSQDRSSHGDDHALEEDLSTIKGLDATLVWAAYVCHVVGFEANACLTADR